jgi:hypothetical protein
MTMLVGKSHATGCHGDNEQKLWVQNAYLEPASILLHIYY